MEPSQQFRGVWISPYNEGENERTLLFTDEESFKTKIINILETIELIMMLFINLN